MSSRIETRWTRLLVALGAALIFASGCGKTDTASGGNVAMVVPPLMGANSVLRRRPNPSALAWALEGLASGFVSLVIGDAPAFAANRTFTHLKLCNDTLVITDADGRPVAVNGSTEQAGLGLLSFTSTNSTSQVTLASLTIASGTRIKEVKITSAVKGSVCSGATYAVQFDPGTGPISITQDTAFKFTFSSPVTISGSAQNLSLLFGEIVDGMLALAQGSGLTNSSIQSVAAAGVGQ